MYYSVLLPMAGFCMNQSLIPVAYFVKEHEALTCDYSSHDATLPMWKFSEFMFRVRD